jgi:hypothetical protein
MAPHVFYGGFPMPKKSKKKWSQDVTDNSNAMDLEGGVFNKRSAKKIADSLKESAEQSDRRKSGPFPICHVDAELLHQSCRQAALEVEDGDARQGQG